MICKNCNSNWENSTNMIVVTCPFCQQNLIDTIDNKNPVSIIENLVDIYAAEIYENATKFKSLLADFLSTSEENKRVLKLLRIVIENDGAKEIYYNINATDNEFDIKMKTLLLRKTLIIA